MKQPTDKQKLDWLARCRIATCQAVRIKCPVCKKFGHTAIHAKDTDNPNFHATISIQHSHFVEQQDAGRNIYCETEIKEEIPPSKRKTKQDITPDYKQRLKDKYSEMWKK